jgi:hypothetical protein
VEACVAAEGNPLIAMGRQPHHPPLTERFSPATPVPDNPTPVDAMAHRLKTPEGRALYALRKRIPGPVFGIISSQARMTSACQRSRRMVSPSSCRQTSQ